MKKVFVILLTAGFLAAMSACGDRTPAPASEPQVEETTPSCNEQGVSGDEETAEPATETPAE
jgi:predicted small lipoprotein YifL